MPLIEATASVTFVSTADILLFISVKLPSVAKPSVFPFNSLMAPTMFFAEVSKSSVPIFVFIELIPSVFVSTRPANSVKADASALVDKESDNVLTADFASFATFKALLAFPAISEVAVLIFVSTSESFMKPSVASLIDVSTAVVVA